MIDLLFRVSLVTIAVISSVMVTVIGWQIAQPWALFFTIPFSGLLIAVSVIVWRD